MCSCRSSAGSPLVPADRLVLVHGFTQTARSWSSLAKELADQFEVLSVDAPGHGGAADVRADVTQAAQLVGEVGGPATYVGYSMGGRICLRLAIDSPQLVRRLVLISATAGIEDPAEREARRQHDEELASSVERDGVDVFVDRWVAQPLLAGLADPGVADRRRNTMAGLASSLRLAGTGAMEPVWDRLPELAMPVLLVAGERDTKFVALAERMAALIPHSELVIVAGSGHTVHLERADAFVALLADWLSR